MKQTLHNKEMAEKELNVCVLLMYTHSLLILLQEALEKKQGELEALQVEIKQLDQSLSQMSVDKEDLDRVNAKLMETEEKLAQASRELQTYRGKVC